MAMKSFIPTPVTVSIKMKDAFFNSEKVIKSIGKGRARYLRISSSLVRRAARQLVRYAKKAPPHPSPGPPRSRVTGSEFGLRNILFALTRKGDNAVVGPMGSGRSTTTVPEIHEKGLTVTRRFTPRGSLRRSNSKFRSGDVVRTVHYPIRPFMQPSLQKESPKFPAIWKDSVK